MVLGRTRLLLQLRQVLAWNARPRRSVLYVPGSNAKAITKAQSLPVDGIILDLEDAVAPSKKAEARQNVASIVQKKPFGNAEVIVRINALDTPWGRDDLAAACGLPDGTVDAVLLPKVETPSQVLDVVSLGKLEQRQGVRVMCMIETPRGVLNVGSIASSSRLISALVMGTSDLTNDLHAEHTPDRLPMLTSLSLCVLAARAVGVYALDGVHLNLDDDAEFVAHCEQGRKLGFDGKTLIHPKTIDVANKAFSPSEKEAEKARKIITEFEKATAAGSGVVVVDGKLIENLHVANAKRVLAIVDAIQKMK